MDDRDVLKEAYQQLREIANRPSGWTWEYVTVNDLAIGDVVWLRDTDSDDLDNTTGIAGEIVGIEEIGKASSRSVKARMRSLLIRLSDDVLIESWRNGRLSCWRYTGSRTDTE